MQDILIDCDLSAAGAFLPERYFLLCRFFWSTNTNVAETLVDDICGGVEIAPIEN